MGPDKDADKQTMPAMLHLMPRKKTIWILAAALCLLLSAVGAIGIPVAQRVRAFFVEDSIHGTFYPVANALYEYQRDHGRPAESLAGLLPKYLAAIPSSQLADAPAYRASPDGSSWELVLHSRALSRPRLYICRSTQEFSPEESRRMIVRYHGIWAVFPADQ